MQKKPRLSRGLWIAIVGVMLFAGGIATAVIAFTLSTHATWTKNTATIAWYSDAARTTPIGATLPLGAVDPNATIQKTVYIYNNGTMEVTLNLTATGFSSPEAAADVTVSWNREGYTLTPLGQVQAAITIVFKDGIYASGSFDLKVNAIAT